MAAVAVVAVVAVVVPVVGSRAVGIVAGWQLSMRSSLI